MNVEDRVRAATRERAHLVRDVCPLDLPAVRPARLSRLPGVRWSKWLAPVTAAAVVVALAVTTVALREVRNGPSVTPAASAKPGTPVIAAAAVLPKYYAALDDLSGAAFDDKKITQPVGVVVNDTITGQRIATVAPPKGQTFTGLTAAADDHTFVVATASLPVPDGEYSTAPVAWYLLRIAPGTAKAATLTKLSIPGQPTGTEVSGIALSPDGSELAVMFQRGVWGVGGKTGPLTLSVYSVSTGTALRTWTQPTKGFPAGYGWYWGRYSNSSITWLAGGRSLAFDDGTNSGANGPPLPAAFSGVKIRTLDVTRPGGDLLADSKVVYAPANHGCMTLQLTADGKTVFCGAYGGNFKKKSSANDPEVFAYSVATGRARLVYRFKGVYNIGLANVLWASPDGSALVVSAFAENYAGRQPALGVQVAGLITKGIFKGLNLKPLAPLAGEIAF
jgi:hypothetical protein